MPISFLMPTDGSATGLSDEELRRRLPHMPGVSAAIQTKQSDWYVGVMKGYAAPTSKPEDYYPAATRRTLDDFYSERGIARGGRIGERQDEEHTGPFGEKYRTTLPGGGALPKPTASDKPKPKPLPKPPAPPRPVARGMMPASDVATAGARAERARQAEEERRASAEVYRQRAENQRQSAAVTDMNAGYSRPMAGWQPVSQNVGMSGWKPVSQNANIAGWAQPSRNVGIAGWSTPVRNDSMAPFARAGMVQPAPAAAAPLLISPAPARQERSGRASDYRPSKIASSTGAAAPRFLSRRGR